MNKMCFAKYTSPEGRRRVAVFSDFADLIYLQECVPLAMIEPLPLQVTFSQTDFFELGNAIDRYRRGDDGCMTVRRLWKLNNYRQGGVEPK